MRSLTSRQVKALSEAIRVLYTVDEKDDFGTILIRAADLLFSNAKISVDEVMIPDGQVVHWADKDFPTTTQELWPEVAHEHPAVKYIAGGGKSPVIAISDFLTQREFLHLGLYREIYKPNEIRDQIATLIPLPASTLGLAICGAKPFHNAEKDCLEALHPHLLPAYRQFQKYLHLTGLLRLSSEALEASRDGIIHCARNGRIMIANQAAQGMLTRYFPSGTRAATTLPEIIRRAVIKKSSGSMEVPGSEGTLHLNWSPTRESGHTLLLTETRRDMVREKARAHGLTPRECEVVHWLAQGKTNNEIACILGISGHTSRTHVEKILSKLQVSTRTAVAAKLMA